MKFDKDIAKIKRVTFFETQCIYVHICILILAFSRWCWQQVLPSVWLSTMSKKRSRRSFWNRQI